MRERGGRKRLATVEGRVGKRKSMLHSCGVVWNTRALRRRGAVDGSCSRRNKRG